MSMLLKSDRQAAITTLLIFALGALLFITISIGRHYYKATHQPDTTDVDRQQHGFYGNSSESNATRYYAVPEKAVRLQRFDPNTADSTLLLQLGLQPWQVRAIYRYRANGGVYTRPEDFARLYGLTAKKYRELRPYIVISPDYRPAADLYASHTHANASGNAYNTDSHGASGNASQGSAGQGSAATVYPRKLKANETLSINSADTFQMQRIPGVGPYFARRMLKYRNQLGGFVSKEQLLEIQDFPEEALQYITIDTHTIHKLNINTLTVQQLRQHPYISPFMARQISDYRRLNGRINDLSDLALLPAFSEAAIKRLRPYIAY